ncbi:UPF0272 protein [Deferribacterales bacterium]|nr:UPF0272 protein [Deferribacterales bacterium]
MNLAAMLELGLPADHLKSELAKLNLTDRYTINITKASKHGIMGTQLDVLLASETDEHHTHRNLADIEKIINDSTLNDNIKKLAREMFTRLATAEAKVHGTTVEQIHFHEVGATDSIIDIVGAAIALDYLKPAQVLASTVQLGGGFVECAHGTIPIPAPATIELLYGAPTKTGLVPFETTTPTGAVILAHNVDVWTDTPQMTITKIGYGLGKRDLSVPNMLRVYLAETKSDIVPEKQYILETNIDDMNPELYSYVEEKLLSAGALDVFKTPIMVKKGRLAVKLSILVTPAKEAEITKIIWTQTSSIGIRKLAVEKIALKRSLEKIPTEYGELTIKRAYLDDVPIKYKAEYEECKLAAERCGMPISAIYDAVARAMDNNNADKS